LARAAMEILLQEDRYQELAHVVLEHLYPTCSWESAVRRLMGLLGELRSGTGQGVSVSTNPDDKTAAVVIQDHHQSLLKMPGVLSVQLRQAIMVVVEKGRARDIPKQIDGIDVVIREVDGIKFSSAPIVRPGDRVYSGEQAVGCVGPLVVDSIGNLFAMTAAHVLQSENLPNNISIGPRPGHVMSTQPLVDPEADAAFLVLPTKAVNARQVDSVLPLLGSLVRMRTPDGILSGTIRGIQVSLRLELNGEEHLLEDLFEVELQAGRPSPGCSGALVEAEDGSPMGILLAMTVTSEKETVYARPLSSTLVRNQLRLVAVDEKAQVSGVKPRVPTFGVLVDNADSLAELLKLMDSVVRVSHGVGVYFEGTLAKDGPRALVQLLPSSGNLSAAVAATNMLRDVQVDFMLLVGLAAGLRQDLRAGDVVVSSEIVHYEPAKMTAGAVTPRFNIVAVTPQWANNLAGNLPLVGGARLFVGAIGSGEKIIADRRHLDELLGGWSRVIAIEMEGAGVAQAVSSFHGKSPAIMLVKGIADIVGESKGGNLRQEAAKSAAVAAVRIAEAIAGQSRWAAGQY
jgi:nucleoside phosphorylase